MARFNLKNIVSFTKELFTSFSDDNVMSKSAALAYYTVFSLAPILIIMITVAGFIFGQDAALRNEIFTQLEGMMGKEAASQIQQMVSSTSTSGSSVIATVLSIATLIFGATGVFSELKTSLNTIWGVKTKPQSGIWSLVRERLLSFAMVISLGFVMLVTLGINAAVAIVVSLFSNLLPGIGEIALQVLNVLISIGVTAVLFALIFKALPDVKIKYSDVWKGAFFTSILFTVGKWLIGLYIGQSDIGGTYGAAGSLVIIFLWVYYSSVILFLGAEFTYVYAQRFGKHIVPTEHAVLVELVEKPTPTGENPTGNTQPDTSAKPSPASRPAREYAIERDLKRK